MSCQDDIFRVGSRKSPLALAQTNQVIDDLKKVFPDKTFEIVTITTTGDHILDKSLSKIGEKSLFTKELEVALEKKEVDFLVHSLKDLPTTLPRGLVIGAISKRINPHDAVVLRSNLGKKTLDQLDEGSVLGTSSLRRVAQLSRNFPHLRFNSVRGNLNTRLKKLEDGDDYVGLILAAAGLIRMGWEDKITQTLGPTECMHAVGQGALAIECREDDERTSSLIATLNDTKTTLCCAAERAFMKTLEGGCTVPIAVSTYYKEDQLHLRGGVYSLDGSECIVESIVKDCKVADKNDDGPPTKKLRKEEPATVPSVDVGICCSKIPLPLLNHVLEAGESLAQTLLNMGAKEILDRSRKAQSSST